MQPVNPFSQQHVRIKLARSKGVRVAAFRMPSAGLDALQVQSQWRALVRGELPSARITQIKKLVVNRGTESRGAFSLQPVSVAEVNAFVGRPTNENDKDFFRLGSGYFKLAKSREGDGRFTLRQFLPSLDHPARISGALLRMTLRLFARHLKLSAADVHVEFFLPGESMIDSLQARLAAGKVDIDYFGNRGSLLYLFHDQFSAAAAQIGIAPKTNKPSMPMFIGAEGAIYSLIFIDNDETVYRLEAFPAGVFKAKAPVVDHTGFYSVRYTHAALQLLNQAYVGYLKSGIVTIGTRDLFDRLIKSLSGEFKDELKLVKVAPPSELPSDSGPVTRDDVERLIREAQKNAEGKAPFIFSLLLRRLRR